MANAPTVQERTMRMREVILRAVNRELTWIRCERGPYFRQPLAVRRRAGPGSHGGGPRP